MKIVSSSWIQYDRLNDVVIDHAIDKHNMKILYNKKLEPTCIPPGFNRHYKIHDVQRYYVKYGTDIHTLHLVEKAYDDNLNMLYEVHEIQDEHDRYWELISKMVAHLCTTQCYEGFSLNAVLVPASINELTLSARQFVDSEYILSPSFLIFIAALTSRSWIV